MRRAAQLVLGTAAIGSAGMAAALNYSTGATVDSAAAPPLLFDPGASVPSRAAQLAALQQGTKATPYDVLIIGGGATGTGAAVDAVSRCCPCQRRMSARQALSGGRSTCSSSTGILQGPAHGAGGAGGLWGRHLFSLNQTRPWGCVGATCC